MQVRDAMTRRAETVAAGETLAAAARRMRELDVGALVVRREGEPVGIVTDRDIVVRAVAEAIHPACAVVETAMTAQVLECQAEDELEVAAARMEGAAVRRLLVRDAEGNVVGLLSLDDVALHRPALAGEILEHVRAPEHPLARDPWPWWAAPPG